MLPDSLGEIPIHYAAVPPHLDGATSCGVLWQTAPDRFWFEAPDTARYLVEDGKRFVVDPLPAGDEAEVCRFLRMTPLAALLFQRGHLVFHAAAVAGPDGAILIAGDSGAGKSTLIAALLKRGWNFLADDLAVVDSAESGLPVVLPTFPELALWADAMERLDIEDKGQGKRVLPMKDRFATSPRPLRALYRLSVHKEGIALSDIQGMKLFTTLAALSYNSRIADALLDRAAFMRQAAVIAGNVPMRNLRRPRGRWCVDELADVLERECR